MLNFLLLLPILMAEAPQVPVAPVTGNTVLDWVFAILSIVIFIVASLFGNTFLNTLKVKTNSIADQRLGYLASWAVKFVEQTLPKAASKEKLNTAVTRLSKLASDEGIKVSPEKAVTLIETVVFELNAALHNKADTPKNNPPAEDTAVQ